jgi:hypothetical protein
MAEILYNIHLSIFVAALTLTTEKRLTGEGGEGLGSK